MGRSGGPVARWVRKVGRVNSCYGLVEILKLNSRPFSNQRVGIELLGQLKK